MYGIEKLKNALAFAINLGEALDKRLEDGKLSFVEGITLIPSLKDLPEVISSSKDIWKEFLDLDSTEKDELISFIETELDLENDKVEDFIQTSLKFVSELSVFVGTVRAMTNDSVGGGGPGGDHGDGNG